MPASNPSGLPMRVLLVHVWRKVLSTRAQQVSFLAVNSLCGLLVVFPLGLHTWGQPNLQDWQTGLVCLVFATGLGLVPWVARREQGMAGVFWVWFAALTLTQVFFNAVTPLAFADIRASFLMYFGAQVMPSILQCAALVKLVSDWKLFQNQAVEEFFEMPGECRQAIHDRFHATRLQRHLQSAFPKAPVTVAGHTKRRL